MPHCLESVRGVFDEIVVVDTGSVDRTAEIAREFGAKVFDFAWVDDFAAARNAALARATGDYAFWLDADDVVEPPEREKLAGAARRACGAGDEAAYVVRCACDPGADGSGGETVVDHIRLFPLRERCPLDLSRPRADPAGPAAGQRPGALDRPDRAAHRLRRPGAAGQEARARQPDPPRGAGRPAR